MLPRTLILAFCFQAATAFAANPPSAGTIEGTVVLRNGYPANGAEVKLQEESASNSLLTVKTDGKGHYAATGLAPGEYKLIVMIEKQAGFSAS